MDNLSEGDKLSPMSVFTGTKWPKPLIHKGLKDFVPVSGNRGQIVPNICFHGAKWLEPLIYRTLREFVP